MMPGMNGRALAQIVRARRPGLPVLYTSGYASDVLDGIGLTADDGHFLAKPFSPDQLLALVHAALLRGTDGVTSPAAAADLRR